MKAWRWALPAAVLAGLIGLALVPTETRQGVDGHLLIHRLPLYVKTIDFVQRDSYYKRTVARVVPKNATPLDRTMMLYRWTRENIRDTPSGFPIVDDHVSHIMIRGYGESDQKADVFTTLVTYAGTPAYLDWLGTPHPPYLVLSFVWIDKQWRVFDLENGIVFRNRRGELASAEELVADPSLIESAAGGRQYASRPYISYFATFHTPTPGPVLRPELQMIWPRVASKVRSLVGFGTREWQVEQ